METRLQLLTTGQEAVKALFPMGKYLQNCRIEKTIQELVKIRVSQLNSCAYCLDMHWKDARALGETEQRLYGINAWEEAPYYNERERAALQFAEAITFCKVPAGVYNEAAKYFSEEELVDLSMLVTSTNTWNRLNHAFPQKVGSYQPGQWS